MTGDFNKLLASCLAFISNEIKKQSTLVEQRLRADLGAGHRDIDALKEEIVREAVASFPLELPDELIYACHLDDATRAMSDKISETKSQTVSLLDEVRAKLNESLSETNASLTQNIDEKVNKLNELIEQSIKAVTEELGNKAESLLQKSEDDKSRLVEQISASRESAEERISELSERTSQQFISASQAYGQQINDTYQKLVGALKDHKSETQEAFNRSVEDVVERTGHEIEAVRELVKTTTDAITRRHKELHSSKADANHSHSEFASANHYHEGYADRQQVDRMAEKQNALSTKYDEIRSTLSGFADEIKKKAGRNEVLSKEDLDSVIDKVRDQVKKTIPEVKDGKDAFQWEFKWSDKVKGRLLFKREDWKDWKYEDLLVKASSVPASGNFLAGGGMGDGRSELIFKQDGDLVDGNVVEVDIVGAEVNKLSNGSVEVVVGGATGEPTGFPNRTDSAISFDDATRTFSISPVGASYDVYLASRKKTISTVRTLMIPDVEGLHYFYFDVDTQQLTTTHTFSEAIFRKHAVVAIVYWQPALARSVYFADERHGIVMDGATHAHFHLSFGTQYRFGLGLTGLTVDGVGSADSEARFGIQNGRIADEDLEIDIVNGMPQQLSSVLRAPVFYRLGSDNSWYSKPADDFAFIQAGSAPQAVGTRPSGNVKVGSVWNLQQVGDNKYVLVHILATNDVRTPVISISGGIYDTKAAARSGAELELLSITGIPFAEFVPVATLILQCKDAFANTVNAAFVSTASGAAYIDWRQSNRLSSGSDGESSAVVEEPYVQNLAGTNVLIASATHNKRQYSFIRVYNASRRLVTVDAYQEINGDIRILSNVALDNHYVVVTNP